MMIENKKPVYIMSLEASDIYYHHHRDMNLQKEYVGMIPFSLELIKLSKSGLKTSYLQKRDKFISNDIINVKFNTKVKNAEDMIEVVKNKIEHSKKEEYASELISFKEVLEHHSITSEDGDYWDSIATDKLRKELYLNGFEITTTHPKTKIQTTTKYVVYKRSSAKSRTGQCLFIKENLYKKMIEWSRLDLPFKEGQSIDLASLLAYESLVGSTLEDTIEIDTSKILIVNDVDSVFKEKANVVRKNEDTGFLDSFKETATISNSLFDGESLLESKYFKDGKSMILLRNHMFKSASFNCNIQSFLKDYLPVGIEYSNWKILNMFGQEIKASDIEMIITPSSLKALKFSNIFKDDSDLKMWEHWKRKVKEDGSIFGVCKSEKESKIGRDMSGNVMQQTSYQMINCLPVSEKDIQELSYKEKEYIDLLKNDDDYFIADVYKNIDAINSNETVCEMYRINPDIIDTQPIKKFRSLYINGKITHAKKGKIKVSGDYCVLLGNPIEFLYHSIGLFKDIKSIELHDNQVYCNAYKEEEELIGFRNPHTSPSNVLIMINKKSEKIEKYLNLSSNIIIVNAINFALQDILSGCDYDSDTMLVSNESKLVEIGKRCFRKYDVCINKIKGDTIEYFLDSKSHYDIDNKLSHSQRNIGRVVNLGQLCMSVYWDLINNKETGEKVNELLKKVDVMTVLSGIAIDMAKKFYDIDMAKEIQYVSKNKTLNSKKGKPDFWVYVSQNKNIKNNIETYKCPMDYLIEDLSNLKRANPTKSLDLDLFINDYSISSINNRHRKKVDEVIENYRKDMHALRCQERDEDILYYKLREKTDEYIDTLKKLSLKAPTIATVLMNINNMSENSVLRAIKILFDSHRDELLSVFKVA